MERLKNPPKWELYDLASDPNELRNRVGDSSLVDVEARLRQQLAAWQEQTGDPFVDADFFQSIEAKFHRPK